MLGKSRPAEACLPAACLLDSLNYFYSFPFHLCLAPLFLPLPHMQTPAIVTHHLSPAMVHPTTARHTVTRLGLCLWCLNGCPPIAEHSDLQRSSAFSQWAHKPVCFLPPWLPVSTACRETPFPLSNKIETGQWIQKSAREMAISSRDPINCVFFRNHFGNVAGLKATDYSIEKCTLFSVIQRLH